MTTGNAGQARHSGLVYRKLRAPREDGGRLLDPPLSEFPQLWEANLRNVFEHPCDAVSVRPRDARLELSGRIDPPTSVAEEHVAEEHVAEPVVMTGHQPELFHPGVWFKNFVVGHLASRVGATALHVVMDNDVVADPAIQVPTFRDGRWYRKRIAYDIASAPIPHEERKPLDRRLFDSFPQRVTETLGDLVREPLVKEFWPLAVNAADEGHSIGDCFVAARCEIERRRGLNLGVLRMSELAATRSFADLCLQIMLQVGRFRQIHNDVLQEYRSVHRIRSAIQPMPDLREDGEWIEFPCWVWTAAHPTRRHLFVRLDKASLEISDRASFHHRLDGDRESRVDQWLELERSGIKIRPKAMLATAYFRLLLCDCFVHGIGGGKYDQVTDEIIRRMFGFELPIFQIATSTHHLSNTHRHVEDAESRRAIDLLRDLRFHAERHAPLSEETQRLAQEKQFWTTGTWQAEHSAKERHNEVQRINVELGRHVEGMRVDVLSQLDVDRRALEACRVLESREYSFCLFSDEQLSHIWQR